MSIFAKKQESDQKAAEGGGAPATTHAHAARGGYGIAEAIQLLRGLPVDQNPDLVVRVVRATLASLSVQLTDIIDDANKKQKATQERIAIQHAKVAELEKQLGGAPQGDRDAGGRPERDDDGEGTAADGREGRGAPTPLPLRERAPRPAHDHAAAATSCTEEAAARISRCAPRRVRLGDAAVVVARAGAETDRPARAAAPRSTGRSSSGMPPQILDGAAQRDERNEIRARVAPQHARSAGGRSAISVQVEDDEARHRLHQHLSGLQARRDSGHRKARLLQHATKLTPGPRIGVRQ